MGPCSADLPQVRIHRVLHRSGCLYKKVVRMVMLWILFLLSGIIFLGLFLISYLVLRLPMSPILLGISDQEARRQTFVGAIGIIGFFVLVQLTAEIGDHRLTPEGAGNNITDGIQALAGAGSTRKQTDHLTVPPPSANAAQ